jgi:hypothetical protein
MWRFRKVLSQAGPSDLHFSRKVTFAGRGPPGPNAPDQFPETPYFTQRTACYGASPATQYNDSMHIIAALLMNKTSGDDRGRDNALWNLVRSEPGQILELTLCTPASALS